MSAFGLIAAEKANHPVDLMCRVLGVSRSGFYTRATRAPSDQALSDAWLLEQIREIHRTNSGVNGAPRIQAELRLGRGKRHASMSNATTTTTIASTTPTSGCARAEASMAPFEAYAAVDFAWLLAHACVMPSSYQLGGNLHCSARAYICAAGHAWPRPTRPRSLLVVKQRCADC